MCVLVPGLAVSYESFWNMEKVSRQCKSCCAELKMGNVGETGDMNKSISRINNRQKAINSASLANLQKWFGEHTQVPLNES